MSLAGNTRFGTHRALPGLELNICQGRALFPSIGMARAGIAGSGQGRDLFRGGANAGLLKASANLGYSFRLGICGPGWAGSFLLQQTSETNIQLQNNSAHLGGSDTKDAFAGGFFAGAVLSVGVGIGIEVFCGISVRCRRWKCSVSVKYCNVGGFSASVNIDLISLMAQLAGFETDFSVPGYGSSIDITGDGYGIVNQGGPAWNNSIQPKFEVQVNLINLIPKVGQINQKLGRFGTGLNLGPGFAVVFPITFRISNYATNINGQFKQYRITGNRDSNDNIPMQPFTPYTQTYYEDVRVLRQVGRWSWRWETVRVERQRFIGGLNNPGTGRATARVEWTIRTTFEIFIYGGFQLLWVINLGVRVGFPVGNLIPALRAGLFTQHTDLTSSIGNTGLGAVIAGLPSDCGCNEPAIAEGTPTFQFAERTLTQA